MYVIEDLLEVLVREDEGGSCDSVEVLEDLQLHSVENPRYGLS